EPRLRAAQEHFFSTRRTIMTDLVQLFGDPHPVAFITGSAAPRIGRVVAEAFHDRGYRVVVHGNRQAEEARRLAGGWSERGPAALAVTGDLRNEQTVERCFADIDHCFGRIDVLVNCAAIWEPKSLEQVTADDVRRYFEVNTLSTFLCCQQ